MLQEIILILKKSLMNLSKYNFSKYTILMFQIDYLLKLTKTYIYIYIYILIIFNYIAMLLWKHK